MIKARRVTSSPLYVQLLLTRQCNLNCIYCSAEQFNEKEKEPELNTTEWVSLLERLRNIGVFNIDFSGGEVFSRKDIFEILENAVKWRFPKISINTNGTLISAHAAESLKRMGLRSVMVSLDGDEDAHDQLRGAGSFSQAIRGIGNLAANGIIPGILFSPLKTNYKKLPGMVNLLSSFGIERIAFNRMHPTGKFREIYKTLMLDCLEDSEEFRKIILDIRENHRGMKIDNLPMVYQDFPGNYSKNESRFKTAEKQKLKPCSAGHTSCNITADGWVIPCSELLDFKGGNIRENDILDIWRNSENFRKIRNLANLSVERIACCKECKFSVFCNAGCRADAYAIYGELMAPDPFCPYCST